MADRPIIFSGPMVRALLDGRKTQTRRVLKPQPVWKDGGWYWRSSRYDNGGGADYFHTPNVAGIMGAWIKAMPYVPGDRLWVRETTRAVSVGPNTLRGVAYDADGDMGEVRFIEAPGGTSHQLRAGKLTPAIHVPRWASRLTLIVEAVKVERLQAISEENAKAEGVEPLHQGFYPYGIRTFMTCMIGDREVPAQYCPTAWQSFQMLWDYINGPAAWDANPWVVAVTFRVLQRNIDSIDGS